MQKKTLSFLLSSRTMFCFTFFPKKNLFFACIFVQMSFAFAFSFICSKSKDEKGFSSRRERNFLKNLCVFLLLGGKSTVIADKIWNPTLRLWFGRGEDTWVGACQKPFWSSGKPYSLPTLAWPNLAFIRHTCGILTGRKDPNNLFWKKLRWRKWVL